MTCRITIFLAFALCAAVGAAGCGKSSGGGTYAAPGGSANPHGGGGSQAAVTVHIPVGAAGKGTAAFGTNPLVVTVGTVVSWVNDDTMAHTSTSDTGVWDSGTLNPGHMFSFTFNTTGTFPYFCTIHGVQSMSGTIQVTTAPAASGGGGGGY